MSWNAHEADFTTEQIPFPYASSPVTSAQSLTPVWYFSGYNWSYIKVYFVPHHKPAHWDDTIIPPLPSDKLSFQKSGLGSSQTTVRGKRNETGNFWNWLCRRCWYPME